MIPLGQSQPTPEWGIEFDRGRGREREGVWRGLLLLSSSSSMGVQLSVGRKGRVKRE